MNQIKIKYDTAVLSLPGRVLDVMDRASVADLKVLMALCASPELCTEKESDDWIRQIAEAASCDAESVKSSLSFWRGTGLIMMNEQSSTSGKGIKKETVRTTVTTVSAPSAPVDEPADEPAGTSVKKVKLRPKDELPHYTTEQLTTLLESHQEISAWIGECQRVFGKMFNTHEVNTILGFVDYLGLDWEYVLCLIAYYVNSREKRGLPKSIKGAETMAYDFYNRDIHTLPALQEELHRMELYAETEGQLRTLFGMGERSLTPKEKKCFSTWLYEYSYGMDVIRMAYDVTVDAKGSPNISYMNSVLANWHRDGLKTPEDIMTAAEAHKNAAASKNDGKKKRAETQPSGSFDTDDFFAAAVRRSFGEDTSSVHTKKD